MSKLLLKNRDYTFIIARTPHTCSETDPYFLHWREAQTAIIKLAKKCQEYDPDGICIYDAVAPFIKYEKTDVTKIAEILQKKHPVPEIDAIAPLEDALSHYFARRESKQYNNGETILVLLDKKPLRSDRLTEIIIAATEKVNVRQETGHTYELAISFVQIGEDKNTAEFLEFLDDDLQKIGAKHDIVDAKKWYDLEQYSIHRLLEDALFD